MSLAAILERLRKEIGLDPESSGVEPIAAAVRRRIAARRLPDESLASYECCLKSSPEEVRALVEEVVIPESWFFRDGLPFELLRRRAVSQLSISHRAEPFRVLSLPCAAGEEPYSVVVALIEAGIAPARFAVVGVDVSTRALDRARRARYSANAFRTVDLAFRDRAFTAIDNGFELRPELAKCVRFEVGNVLDRELCPGGRTVFDAIFCRNLLIYLDPPARALAFDNLKRLLAEEGVLFVGHAEQLLVPGTFQALEPRGAFAFERIGGTGRPVSPRRAPDRSASPELLPLRSVLATTSEPVKPKAPIPYTLPPSTRVPSAGVDRLETRETPSGPGQKPTVLEEAARIAGEGQLAAAVELCERDLRNRGPNASAFALLGMLRQAQGDRVAAENCLSKAVYLDGQHEEALLGLAALAQRRGDYQTAENYRRRAQRAAQERPSS